MVRLQTEAFDPGALLSGFCQGREETGAVVSFTGIARGGAGAVTRLELEAYPGFTDAEIERIAEAARVRFSLQDLLIVHRIGKIAPGEAIVFVATAAAHRRAAFEAADQLMDYLKSRAPFWKKEHGPDGARWIEPTDQDRSDAARWD
ncbi:MAG TPA: molybdenum cofactor biosynthesis protein MoaE [Caulobacteraceae bacterium]